MIRVAILDDHQSILNGYTLRLGKDPEIIVDANFVYGKELEDALQRDTFDVVILDISVPTSAENPNPYPILYVIPALLQRFPEMAVIVISMNAQKTMVRSVIEAGASGYILKEDRAAIQDLATIIRLVAGGGRYFSRRIFPIIQGEGTQPMLSSRELEVLSLCAAYPDITTAELAKRMNVANSTVRNLLSGAYSKLDVNTRAAAILRAQSLGIITPHQNG